MGLDMYLNAKRYLHDDNLISELSEKFPELGDSKIKHITAEVGYWRKANAIHKWFVDNIQKGVDDCGSYEVSKNDLLELLNLVDEVLKNRDQAHKLLPCTSGFFFGSTDYDDYYFEDLEYTKNLLERLTKGNMLNGWYVEYQSSW